MRKKRLLLIGLQVCALTAFLLMALGSKSSTPTVQNSKTYRVDRAGCGSPEMMFLGTFDSPASCSRACSAAGFSLYCTAGDNCYCQ